MRLARFVAGAAVCVSLAVVPAGAAHAAPTGDTRGCAVVAGLFEDGNPGIATAASTPFGYGACGIGVPGGP